MLQKRQRHTGVFAIEAAMSVVLGAMLLAALTWQIRSYVDVRQRYTAQQALLRAAQGELERLRAGWPTDLDAAVSHLPGATLSLIREPGDGLWAGCDLVTVFGQMPTKRGQPIRVQVRGYLCREDTP